MKLRENMAPELFRLAERREMTGPQWVYPSVPELEGLFANLTVDRLIGHGGMAAVYSAATDDGEPIAIKICPPASSESPILEARFENEQSLHRRLEHPHIVTLLESGVVGSGMRYFTMELMTGGELCGPVEAVEAVRLIDEVCAALEHAHSQGIIHRDIKPSNLLKTDAGVVKVADFGLAMDLSSGDSTTSLTMTGTRVGTPHYMAPELFGTGADHTVQSDIYSLGVVFYQLLTGGLPVGRYAPASRTANVPRILDRVLDRALAVDPERRWRSVSELRRALPDLSVAGRLIDRRRWILAGATGLAAFVPGIYFSRPSAPRASDGILRSFAIHEDAPTRPDLRIPLGEKLKALAFQTPVVGFRPWCAGVTESGNLRVWGEGADAVLSAEEEGRFSDLAEVACGEGHVHALTRAGKLISTSPAADQFQEGIYRQISSAGAYFAVRDAEGQVWCDGGINARHRGSLPPSESLGWIDIGCRFSATMFVREDLEVFWCNGLIEPQRVFCLPAAPVFLDGGSTFFTLTMPDGTLRFINKIGAPIEAPFPILADINDAVRTRLCFGRYAWIGAIRHREGHWTVIEGERNSANLHRRPDLEERIGAANDLAFDRRSIYVI